MRAPVVCFAATAAVLAISVPARAGECDADYAQLAQSAQPNDPRRLVNIVVSLGFKGRSIDEAAAKVQQRRYEKDFPDERTIVVMATSAEMLHQKIAAALEPGETVHRLFVDSHGRHNELYRGVFDLIFLDRKQPYLQGPEEFARVLSPLKGHFARDATIVFEGCQVYPSERNESVEISAKLLDLLGMRSGRVYANYSDGTNAQDDLLHPKFRDLHDIESCAIVGLANVLWPLTEAFSGLTDYVLENRGYLYTRLPTGQWCLDKARMMRMRD